MSAIPFHPEYPQVRCTVCATVYEYDPMPANPEPRKCPNCGNGSFNTAMTVPEGGIVVTPGPEAPVEAPEQ